MYSVSNRSTFLVVFGTAVTMYVAQSLQYRGPGQTTFTGILAFTVAVGTVASVLLAAKMIDQDSIPGVLLAICSIAALPLVVGWLLSISNMPVNAHGIAVLGFFTYF